VLFLAITTIFAASYTQSFILLQMIEINEHWARICPQWPIFFCFYFPLYLLFPSLCVFCVHFIFASLQWEYK